MRDIHGLRRTRSGARKRIVLLGCLAATLAVTAGCGSNSDSSSGDAPGTKTLPFGLLVPLSGPAAAFGPPHRASVETAVQRINSEGGIKVGGDTYKVDLHVYDSAFDPTKAVSKAREAITKDGVKFLAIDGGVVTSAVQPIAESSKAVMFALAGGDSFLGTKHPMTFRYYYSIPDSLYAGLTVLKPKLGPNPKLVDLYPDDDIARSIAAQSAEKAKSLGYTASATYVGRDVTDFNAVLTKVIAQDPDVIDFGVMPPSQYAIVVQQARQLGYKGHFIFDDTAYVDTVIKAAGKGSVTDSVSVPYLANFNTPEGKYWYAHLKEHAGGDTSQGWTALGYDNVLLWKAAIEKAQSIDPAKVADALRQVSVEGVLGTVRYGGAKQYGLAQVFDITYPVATITASGKLKKVATINPNQ
jgi:branched-chain amino acid transport system substrate-binding protein